MSIRFFAREKFSILIRKSENNRTNFKIKIILVFISFKIKELTRILLKSGIKHSFDSKLIRVPTARKKMEFDSSFEY